MNTDVLNVKTPKFYNTTHVCVSECVSEFTLEVPVVNGGARGGMIIVVGNGHGDTSSKSWTRLIAFHIALIPLGKV